DSGPGFNDTRRRSDFAINLTNWHGASSIDVEVESPAEVAYCRPRALTISASTGTRLRRGRGAGWRYTPSADRTRPSTSTGHCRLAGGGQPIPDCRRGLSQTPPCVQRLRAKAVM